MLAGHLVSKEEVDSTEIAEQTDFFEVPTTGRGPWAAAIWPEGGIQRIADHPEEFVTYKLTYKCKDCVKECSKPSAERIHIPRENVEDEEEKTDYDAELEANQAREEEMAREQQ